MSTAVNVSIGITGDFTTISAMISSITGNGSTTLANSSTGKTIGTGSTTTAVQLSSSETQDFTWHVLTFTSGALNGVSCFVGSYNTTTKIATIIAAGGYSGTLASAPVSGVSYTIADINPLTLTFGPSSSGSTPNLYSGSGFTLPSSIVADASHGIVLASSIGWAGLGGYPWYPNTSGNGVLPICISANSAYVTAFTVNTQYTTINDLCFSNNGGSGLAVGAHNILNRVTVVTGAVNTHHAIDNGGDPVTLNNCLLVAPNSGNSRLIKGNTPTANGTTFIGGQYAFDNYYTSIAATNCAFFGQGSGYVTGGTNTFTGCAGDRSGTTGVTNVGTLASNFVSLTNDFRPLSGAGIINSGTSPGSLTTDAYGVTRPNPTTPGAVQTGYLAPALKSFTYLVDYSTGDITSMAPAWTGTGSGTGAVVTIVSTITGSLAPGDIIAFKNPNGNAGQGYQDNCVILSFGTYTTVGGTGTVNIDRSYGTAFATTNMQVCAFSRVTGADLTYYQSGFTCPSTAADSTHIVIAAFLQTASVIGHPIQWKTGNTCVCTAYNPSTGIATVAAGPSGAGFNANFGGTPQNGDAYTVYPMALTFNQGLASSGNNEWSLTYYQAGGTGSICWACQTSASSTITWTSVVKWTAPQQLGTINGSGATQPAIINLTTGDTDHTSIVSVQSPCNNLLIQGLQFYIDLDLAGGEEGGACFVGGGANPTTAVKIYQCTCGGYISDDLAHIHPAVLGLGGTGWVFDTCVLYCRGNSYWMEYLLDAATLKFCTVVVTQSAVQTVATGVSSGATTITMNSVTGIVAGTPLLYNRGMVVSDPLGNIPAGTYVQSIAGNVITLSAATTGSVATNATLYFGATNLVANGSVSDPIVATNCAFFGAAIPVSTSSTITSSNNACDVPSAVAGSGFTGGLNFANQFNSAFNVIAGTLDVTPKAGNGLGVGAYDATSTVDIFGTARPSSGTVTAGAVQYASTGPNLATFFALMGVGN